MAYWIFRTDDLGTRTRQDFQSESAAEQMFRTDISRANAWRFVTLSLHGEHGLLRMWVNPRYTKPLEEAKDEYVKLTSAAVRSNPEVYKASVVADPEGSALRVVEFLSLSEVKRLIREHNAEQRALVRHGIVER